MPRPHQWDKAYWYKDQSHANDFLVRGNFAVVAQLVEHRLAKPVVAGSSPVYRSVQSMKSLIVICHHNGSKWLSDLVKSLDGHNVVIVDTSSTDDEQKNCLAQHKLTRFIEGGYAPAAYRAGFELFPNYDEYFFMHDSMLCKDPNFFADFRAKGEMCAWIGFTMHPDSQRCEYNARTYSDLYNLPPYMIFGPIFYATRNALSKLVWPAPCRNHDELVVSERAFAIGFHQAGFEINYIDWFSDHRVDTLRDYHHFDKFRPGRL